MDIHVLRSLNRRCWDFRIHFPSTQLQTRTQLFLSRTNRTTPASFCRNIGKKRYRYLHSSRWIRIDGARLGVLLPVDGEDSAAKVSLWLITVERSGATMMRNVHGWTVECKTAKMPISTRWLFITVSRENQTLPVIMNVTRVHLYIHVILKGMYNIQYIDLYM